MPPKLTKPGLTKPDALTPQQIENWRKVMCVLLGPYAFIMSDSQIQAYRDKLQAKLDADEAKSQGDANVPQEQA